MNSDHMVTAAASSVSALALVVGLLLLVVGLAFYFLPTVVARLRHHPQFAAILVINLLLGWTIIGWIMAFVMAIASKRSRGVPTSSWNAGPSQPRRRERREARTARGARLARTAYSPATPADAGARSKILRPAATCSVCSAEVPEAIDVPCVAAAAGVERGLTNRRGRPTLDPLPTIVRARRRSARRRPTLDPQDEVLHGARRHAGRGRDGDVRGPIIGRSAPARTAARELQPDELEPGRRFELLTCALRDRSAEFHSVQLRPGLSRFR